MIPFTPNPADKSGGAHHDNHHFQRMIAQKEHTAPQHTRFILPLIHPTKSSLRCVGGIFLLWVTHLENFMSRPDMIPTFRQRRCTNRGRNFVRSKRCPPLHEQHNLYLFLRALTIRKQLPRNGFERNGRGQEPSRGHKFSILEKFLSIRDFTSQTLASFLSDLVGVALVGATPLHLLSQTALPLKSPTGAFIAALRFANAVPPQTLLKVKTTG